jgi:protein-L-isoaspartate(D-aspartate) O-methyltransferase
MKKVPRHLFLDEALWPEAYEDHPVPIGEKQTISQPYIVALMTEALKLTGKEKILEIGTGSGYQAAILAELSEQVYSIERLPAIAKRARRILDDLKYSTLLSLSGTAPLGGKSTPPITASSLQLHHPILQKLFSNN